MLTLFWAYNDIIVHRVLISIMIIKISYFDVNCTFDVFTLFVPSIGRFTWISCFAMKPPSIIFYKISKLKFCSLYTLHFTLYTLHFTHFKFDVLFTMK